MNWIEYPYLLPGGKAIIKDCRCSERSKRTSIGNFTSPGSSLPDYIVIDYFCVSCYRRGIIRAAKKWE